MGQASYCPLQTERPSVLQSEAGHAKIFSSLMGDPTPSPASLSPNLKMTQMLSKARQAPLWPMLSSVTLNPQPPPCLLGPSPQASGCSCSLYPGCSPTPLWGPVAAVPGQLLGQPGACSRHSTVFVHEYGIKAAGSVGLALSFLFFLSPLFHAALFTPPSLTLETMKFSGVQ